MWRYTAGMPRFFGLDIRSLAPVGLFLFHMRWWTFYVALAGILFFWLIERWGYTPVVLWRVVRMKLMGKLRPADQSNCFRYRLRARNREYAMKISTMEDVSLNAE